MSLGKNVKNFVLILFLFVLILFIVRWNVLGKWICLVIIVIVLVMFFFLV